MQERSDVLGRQTDPILTFRSKPVKA
jgi:hypothetical protein